MENFNQIFILLANREGIGLNTDILETGLVNIFALLAILINTGKDFLGTILKERKTIILNNVQDAEDRLNEAQKRLSVAEKQLSQAKIIIEKIRKETINSKKNLLTVESLQAKKDLKVRFDRSLATFQSKEQQIFLEIKERILSLVLKRTIIKAQKTFESKERATAVLTETINKLEGDLL